LRKGPLAQAATPGEREPQIAQRDEFETPQIDAVYVLKIWARGI